MSKDDTSLTLRVLIVVAKYVRGLRGILPFKGILFGSVFVLSLASFWLAYGIRFEFDIPEHMQAQCLQLSLVVAFGKLLIFHIVGGNTVSWRYVGLKDIPIFVAHAIAGSILIFAISWSRPAWKVPRGVIMIDFFLTLLFVGGSRLLLRMAREKMSPLNRIPRQSRQKRAIIIGAGDGGEMVVRELTKNVGYGIKPVALFDDNRKKLGIRIHGIPVIGAIKDAPAFAEENEIDMTVVAIPSATSEQFNNIYSILKPLGLPIKTLPSFYEMIEEVSAMGQLREINITDLLGRQEIQINTGEVHSFIANKTVLVTGAGGSIGSELCRQIVKRNPRKLVLVERSENGLFHIHRELSERTGIESIQPVLCDITNDHHVLKVFERFRPQVVFHAAAHKHVPIQEADPAECFRNNVGGTIAATRAADKVGAEHFVMISSDKAVNPTSVMGATKRVCELYCQAQSASSRTNFVSVRFGNVLASDGSVVPIFMEQISRGGPITVTHPDMKRYFMTIPEAVMLVLQAAVLGQSGQVLILDMGPPIRIVDLVDRLLELTGNTRDTIPIKFIGLRPGEKLFEELLCTDEMCLDTVHEKVKICRNVSQENMNGNASWIEESLKKVMASGDPVHTRMVLKNLVPEYEYGDNGH